MVSRSYFTVTVREGSNWAEVAERIKGAGAFSVIQLTSDEQVKLRPELLSLQKYLMVGCAGGFDAAAVIRILDLLPNKLK